MAPGPSLTDLITVVESDAGSSEPLAQLATASTAAAELTESADALVDHFVDRCRAAGRTWAEISEALGVTRQAAHKRYSAEPKDDALMTRFTPRARQAVTASIDAARELRHAGVGTEHMLLGLFPPGGIGATLLTDAGLTRASVTERVLAEVPHGTDAVDAPPFTTKAAEVFSGALAEALSMGHNYIGTEHLLLALFADGDGLAARILADAGATHAACKAAITKILAGFAK